MSHFRKAVAGAVGLNTLITAGEAVAGLRSHSLSLLLDSAHNFSDELALVCLFLAFYLPDYLGRQSQRTANVLNSLGLIILSGIILVQAVVRLRYPVPVAAGLLVALTGRNEADALIALGVGAWLAIATIREVRSSANDLLWPQRMQCIHASTEHA